VDVEFQGALIEWRGPAPHFFVPVPAELCEDLRDLAREVSYGWGAVPVRVRIGGTEWETSLVPKDGGYLVPVRARVRQAEALGEGDRVRIGLQVAIRGGRRANEAGPST
jgi:hypothetical protein